MPKTKDKFEGTWQLIPELCQYDDGHPPLSGSYTIKKSGQSVDLNIDWVDSHERAHNSHYGGLADGSVAPLNGGKMEMAITRLDEHRLDSSTYQNGIEASYVHRKASADGALMVVITVHNHDNDTATRNFQIYRKA